MRSYHRGTLRFLSCYLENKEQDYIVTTRSAGIESGIMTSEKMKTVIGLIHQETSKDTGAFRHDKNHKYV